MAFPVRVFDEELYLLSNDITNLLPFKLLIRLGSGTLGVQVLDYRRCRALAEGVCKGFKVKSCRAFQLHVNRGNSKGAP